MSRRLDEDDRDGIIDFAIGIAALQLVMGAAFTAMTLWIDRPFDGPRRDALVALSFCASVTLFALSFLLRRNWGRLLQAGAYALGTVGLAFATAMTLAESVAGAIVIAGFTAILASAARAYVSPEVRSWVRHP